MILLWGCVVIRMIQVFPAVHVTLDGGAQFLGTTYDACLTLNADFKICSASAGHNERVLQHYQQQMLHLEVW